MDRVMRRMAPAVETRRKIVLRNIDFKEPILCGSVPTVPFRRLKLACREQPRGRMRVVGAIVPFLKIEEGVFDPKDIQAMSMALDDICKALNLTNGQKVEREVIAERIIALAQQGERSPTRLRDRVLQEAALADVRRHG
jgi:hypothetical protein